MALKSFLTFFSILTAVLLPLHGAPRERVFLLKDSSHIEQYFINHDGKISHVASYSEKDFPGLLPAHSLDMRSGNILAVNGKHGAQKGRLVYDPAADRLRVYAGDPGEAASLSGRLLDTPDPEEIFRTRSGLYKESSQSRHRYTQVLAPYREGEGSTYTDLFALGERVYGVSGDHIYQLSDGEGKPLESARTALLLAGADLTSATVSPWGEAFIADTAGNKIHRVVVNEGSLVSEFQVTHDSLNAPGGLDFSASGELYVANGKRKNHAVSRFRFQLGGFKNWWPSPLDGIDEESSGALDVAVARPVGYVISEKTNPIERLSAEAAGGHYGISSTTFLAPDINSESAIIALVEYAPGGNTPVHYHDNMEQIEVVVSGRALWEVGEMEKEVGPGDVIFTPRFVKHGYKVLGDQPFRFLQLEWRGIE